MSENDVVNLALKELNSKWQLMMDLTKGKIDSWKGEVSSAIKTSGSFADLTQKLHGAASLEDSSKNNILIQLANRVRELTILELCESFEARPVDPDIHSANACIEHVLERKFEEKFSKQMLQKCGYPDGIDDVTVFDKAVPILQEWTKSKVTLATNAINESISYLREINPSAGRRSQDNCQLPSNNMKETLDFLVERATYMQEVVRESCDEVRRQRAGCNSRLEELQNKIGNSFVKDLGTALKEMSHGKEETTAFANLTKDLTEAIGQLLGYAHSDKSESEILATVTAMCETCVKAVQNSAGMNEGKCDVMKNVMGSLQSEVIRVITEVRSLFAIEDGKPLKYQSNWLQIERPDASSLREALDGLHCQLVTVTEIRDERDRETHQVKQQLFATQESHNETLAQVREKQQEVDSLSKEKEDVEKRLKAQLDRESSRNEMLRLSCEAQVRKVEMFYQKRVPPTE